MPHSPFTRFLGAVIVALFALFLLWQDDRAHLWGLRATATLPLLLGVFTWNAVRGAAPFDDRSFHRTLPPGDGPAFGRVLMIHWLVLGGIALAVLAYCGIFNLGWRAASYGIAMLTTPVLGWMAVMGLTASLGTSRQHWKSWGYIAIFAVPLFSWGLMQWFRSGFEPETKTSVYFSPLRTMVLTGAVLYPLIWWAIAAKRRRALGMVLAAWTGFLLPWLSVYGDFVKAPRRGELYQQGENEAASAGSKVILTRRAIPQNSGKWIDVEPLLSIDGLGEKEFLSIYGIAVKDWGLPIWSVRAENSPPDFAAASTFATVGRSGGKITWGDQSLWEELASQLPPHQTLRHWTERRNPPARLALLNPEMKQEDWSQEDYVRFEKTRRITADELRTLPWNIWLGSPMRWAKAGECDVAKGGSFRLPEGGILRVDALHREGDHYTISFKRYSPSFRHADGPWFENMEEQKTFWDYPRALLVDESGQHAFIMDSFSYDQGKSFLVAERTQHTFYAGAAGTPENAKRMEMLSRARIHVFWPVITGRSHRVTLPPPE